VRVVTPNAGEAARLAGDQGGDGLAAVARRAHRLRARWNVGGVAVTMGDRGALLAAGDGPALVVPAARVQVVDVCGAGDRFAGACAVALAEGAVLQEAVEAAVASATDYVATGRFVPQPDAPVESSADDVIARVRRSGGTVVMTGGCFDLVHAGHIATLEAARRLGDCLIVCMNSDGGVRRLKGPGRPLQREDDRARVLAALSCVDAVVVFDDDTPDGVLRRFRPDVFVKGGDYGVGPLPEARTLAAWGGEAVVVPYVTGRSTSGLVKEAIRRGA
jgi:D-beta-D-heptose 7-phosphate kinase / D-beta-D-heptose 1-phosphate adenosyltransferase